MFDTLLLITFLSLAATVTHMQYFYLHGFASSPNSVKARQLQKAFRANGLQLHVPDLSQDFSTTTVSKQLESLATIIDGPEKPTALVGSSLGGLTAAILADRMPNIERIVLLNPAFGFPEQWLNTLGPDTVNQWKETGWHQVYHYGYQEHRKVHWEFIQDLQENYNDTYKQLKRPVPTLVCAGRKDPVIPVQLSRNYAASRDHYVRLLEYEQSGHTLTNVLDSVMEETIRFLLDDG